MPNWENHRVELRLAEKLYRQPINKMNNELL
jgi:hypothetical protein